MLRKMGYDGQGLGKSRQDILSPVVDTLKVKHEGLGSNGKWENPMTMKTTFVKSKDMVVLACSLKQREAVKEEGSTLPLHASYGQLKKYSDEESENT
jgi:hypothetical protein